MSRIILTLLLFTLNICAFSQERKVGLVIIDMQKKFMTRKGFHRRPQNIKKVNKLIEHQILIIEKAMEYNIPIFVIEFENQGDTIDEIKNLLSSSATGQVNYFKKDTNGFLSGSNSYKAEIIKSITDQKITDLCFIGANGGACVEGSIHSAISKDLNSFALVEGIADFNYKSFIYPYRYSRKVMKKYSTNYNHIEFKQIRRLDRLISFFRDQDSTLLKQSYKQYLVDYLKEKRENIKNYLQFCRDTYLRI